MKYEIAFARIYEDGTCSDWESTYPYDSFPAALSGLTEYLKDDLKNDDLNFVYRIIKED